MIPSFSSSVLAAVQGATLAEWGYNKKGWKTGYILLDDVIEYNKGLPGPFPRPFIFTSFLSSRVLITPAELTPLILSISALLAGPL